jgi:chromosome segregation ATPase
MCDQYERELAEARNILKQCLSIMPVGYVSTHTVENLPEMIGDLAKALAEETTEREQLERELAEVREKLAKAINDYETAVLREHRMQEQRDTLEEALRVTWEDIDHLKYWMPLPCRAKSQLALAAVKGGRDD